MDLLELDHYEAEVIPRGDTSLGEKADHARRMLAPRVEVVPDKTAIALEMVSEAAAAIRSLEEQSAQAVTRAHDLASAIVQKLELTEARAGQAEALLDQARAEVSELTETVAETRGHLDATRSQLNATEVQLTQMEERALRAERRAAEAEQRAIEANASIERIVDAIRTQLPGAAVLSARG